MIHWFKAALAGVLALGPGARAAGADGSGHQEPGRQMRLAFVLLREPRLPKPSSVIRAYEEIAPRETRRRLTTGADSEGKNAPADSLTFDVGKEGSLVIGLMPVPVPKGEAEAHASMSFLGAFKGWKPEPHRAHLVVVWQQGAALPATEAVRQFAWLLAALGKAAGGLGIYWADSGATHPADYFAAVAGQDAPAVLATIWSGFSVASDRGDPQRMSIVSLGMGQVGLPDLEISSPRSRPTGETVAFMMDLLGYVLERGKAIPEGETVGRTEVERLPVTYVASPVDPAKKVWRVVLPAAK